MKEEGKRIKKKEGKKEEEDGLGSGVIRVVVVVVATLASGRNFPHNSGRGGGTYAHRRLNLLRPNSNFAPRWNEPLREEDLCPYGRRKQGKINAKYNLKQRQNIHT